MNINNKEETKGLGKKRKAIMLSLRNFNNSVTAKNRKAIFLLFNVFIFSIMIIIPVSAGRIDFVFAQEVNYKDLSIQDIREEYARLLKRNEYLVKDRDNILIQFKKLAAESKKYEEENKKHEEDLETVKAALEQTEKEKQNLQNLLMQEQNRSLWGIIKERVMVWIKKFKKD